jgi:hypothetical protein
MAAISSAADSVSSIVKEGDPGSVPDPAQPAAMEERANKKRRLFIRNPILFWGGLGPKSPETRR